MRLIGISLSSHAKMPDVVLAVANSIRKNYGAGTITNPRKHRDYNEKDFLGSWTSRPDDEWATMFSDETFYLIDAGKEVDEYEMARIVETFIPKGKSMSKFEAVIIESERGWGTKVDSTHSFDTVEERDKFVADYNEKWNPPSETVPDWYMVARAV